MKNNFQKYIDIFLAKIVSFDNYSILFQINDLDPCYEDFRLVKVFPNGWAYDLLTRKKYKVLTVINGSVISEELDEIKASMLYVFDMCSFIDVWKSVREVYGIKDNLDTFLDKCINDINELNRLLSPENKIIDFDKVKKLTNERKY